MRVRRKEWGALRSRQEEDGGGIGSEDWKQLPCSGLGAQQPALHLSQVSCLQPLEESAGDSVPNVVPSGPQT